MSETSSFTRHDMLKAVMDVMPEGMRQDEAMPDIGDSLETMDFALKIQEALEKNGLKIDGEKFAGEVMDGLEAPGEKTPAILAQYLNGQRNIFVRKMSNIDQA